MNPIIKIAGQEFSSRRMCVIAEIAQAHDGSLGAAHAYIDAIASSGADAVKFQTHIAVAESTAREPWRIKFSRQDASRYDYWRRMEFTEEQWRGLRQHANERGLIFLSSPFSVEAVEMLRRVGVIAWKVASGEVSDLPMIRAMLEDHIPMLISSGMSSTAELDRLVDLCRIANVPLAVFQCTSAYPCSADKVGINQICELTARYGVPVGLSDHSGTIYPGLAAATLGAALLEVHVTFDRNMFGPDTPASLTFSELRQLVDGVRFNEAMRAAPTDKSCLAEDIRKLRETFCKSIVVRRDLPAGHVLVSRDLTCKKPCDGIPAGDWDRVLGRVLIGNVAADSALQWEHIK